MKAGVARAGGYVVEYLAFPAGQTLEQDAGPRSHDTDPRLLQRGRQRGGVQCGGQRAGQQDTVPRILSPPEADRLLAAPRKQQAAGAWLQESTQRGREHIHGRALAWRPDSGGP